MPLMKRGFACLLTAILLVSLFGAALAEENLLFNGGFDLLDADGLPEGWYTDQWIKQEGYTLYGHAEDAVDGKYCATIENLGMNDARFAQSVAVEPGSLYCLSGYIKASGIPDAGWGANLSVANVYSSTEGCYDTFGEWQYVEVYGETGEDQTQLTVYVRVGGYSGESEGGAQFDGICLRKVDELPEDVVADLWFRPVSKSGASQERPANDPGEVKPFWPWLIALTAAYMVLLVLLFGARTDRLYRRGKRTPLAVSLGLVAAFALRYVIAVLVNGYEVDVNCFLSWGGTMVSAGPGGFYQATSFCDYPPAYLYVMGLNSWVSQLIQAVAGQAPRAIRPEVVIKLVPMLADIAIALCVYRIATEQGRRRHRAAAICLAVAFNPVLIINSAAWCQIDSTLALLLLLVAWMAVKRRWRMVMPLFMLAVLVKPQALMMGFLGLTAIILAWLRDKRARREMLIGTGIALALAAVIVVPFWGQQQPDWLIQKYGETLSSYAYATVNTANLYYLVGANWHAIGQAAHWAVPVALCAVCVGWGYYMLLVLDRGKRKLAYAEPVLMLLFTVFFIVCGVTRQSFAVVGYGAMALAFAIVLPLFLRAGKLETLPLLGGLLFLLLYVLGIKMHERYLFPAFALLAMAWCLRPDKRILLLFAGVTATVFINEGIVLDNSLRLGASGGHLNNDTYALNIALCIVNLLQVPLALWTAAGICVEDSAEPAWLKLPTSFPRLQGTPADLASYQTDPGLHWKRLDTVLILTITLVYGAAAFWHLGSTKAPQTTWRSTAAEESVVIDLGAHYDDFSMLYFAQVSYRDFTVEVSDDGQTWSEPCWAQMAEGLCFRWQYLAPYSVGEDGARSYVNPMSCDSVRKLSGRYVRVTAQQIGLKLNEIIFRESVAQTDNNGYVTYVSGGVIPAVLVSREGAKEESPNYSDPACLLDEQDTLEGEPCWYTGTYFDEIYHARTAYEHLHGISPYETTHPPLGKVLMSWGVAIFGMTPFGWRFAGVLAGVLMLPGIYLLAKQLTKRTSLSAVAALALALDCMHYAQTRIATIDSFPVLFIIWSYLFMVRFMQRDLMACPVKKLLPDLALSGFFMGCGIASKWIGIYAGAGLAVLYFWTCLRHLRLGREAERLLRETVVPKAERELLCARAKGTFERVLTLCLWCILFFVAVPLVIYLLAYIPHITPQRPSGLVDYLVKVWNAQNTMLSYHSTPGLGMNHPFYSPWYEWPLNVRPMYYAMGYFPEVGKNMSIFCFSNPAVTIVGIAALAAVALIFAKRHVYATPGAGLPLQVRSTSWDMAPAFVLVGLLAQYLPWVLVPRGTYIYHYFASLPFLILATVLTFHYLMKRWPRVTRGLMVVYLLACAAYFALLFPYASGMMVSTDWLDAGKKILHVYYIR